MNKTIFYPSNKTKKTLSKGKERITLQFRVYDENGNYDSECENANATIWLKDLDLNTAYKVLENSLMNSKYISKHFEVQ